MKLIESSTKGLRTILTRQAQGFQLAMPYPGCGNGGRTVEEVKPILEKHLSVGLDHCTIVVLSYKE